MGYRVHFNAYFDAYFDALAGKGIAFRQVISSYTVSSPARAMLMTGMYSLKNKLITNYDSRSAPYGVELESWELLIYYKK